MRGGAVDANHAVPGLAGNHIGREARAVGDVVDVDLLVLEQSAASIRSRSIVIEPMYSRLASVTVAGVDLDFRMVRSIRDLQDGVVDQARALELSGDRDHGGRSDRSASSSGPGFCVASST